MVDPILRSRVHYEVTRNNANLEDLREIFPQESRATLGEAYRLVTKEESDHDDSTSRWETIRIM